jgi:hypothetical protein
MNIGYFGVIVPERDFWQAFYLNDDLMAEGRELIATLQREHPDMAQAPSRVLRPLGHHLDAEQQWIGAVSAAIVEFALKKHDYGIGVAAAALHWVAGLKHFIITGHISAEGTYTEIENLPEAKTPHDVRDIINAKPEVIRAKQALMRRASATDDGQHRGRTFH